MVNFHALDLDMQWAVLIFNQIQLNENNIEEFKKYNFIKTDI